MKPSPRKKKPASSLLVGYTAVELVSELLRQASLICQGGGLSIEEFVELSSHAYAQNDGDVIDELDIRIKLADRGPLN